MKGRSFVEWICALAFLMDAGTGVLLIALPRLSLQLMGLDPDGEPIPYLRFIGAFVFAVGCLYGYAWRCLRQGRGLEWRILWLATAWARLCVGSTVLVLILMGDLSVLWISVPVADLGLAIFQFGWLWRMKGVDA